jgi:phenylpropionate dioxygenase-like ring-hydroxylating dioxygenase large terminal subunit
MNTEEKKPKSRRELVRTMGQSGNYWYAMEESKNLKKGKSLEVIFWKSPIALFRGESGKVSAIENRCPHRQLRLTSGIVEGEEMKGLNLRCKKAWLKSHTFSSIML